MRWSVVPLTMFKIDDGMERQPQPLPKTTPEKGFKTRRKQQNPLITPLSCRFIAVLTMSLIHQFPLYPNLLNRTYQKPATDSGSEFITKRKAAPDNQDSYLYVLFLPFPKLWLTDILPENSQTEIKLTL